MRKILRFTFVAMVLLASCSNDEEPGSSNSEASLSVSSASIEAVLTKTSTEVSANGATIGVFRTAYNGYTAQNNVLYTYNLSIPQWVLNDVTQSIYLNAKNAKVYAYTPYVNGLTDPANIPLTAGIYNAATDISYSSGVEVSNANRIASFINMPKAYSKITFSITKDASYTGIGSVSEIKIQGTEIYNTAKLDLVSNATPVLKDQVVGPVSAILSPTVTTSSTPVLVGVMMIPVVTLTPANAIIIEFTVDGNKLSKSITPAFPMLSLTAGTNYCFNVLIKGTSLIIGSVSTINWTDAKIEDTLTPEAL